MKEARYFYVPDAANCTELPVDEAVHALRVLRLQSGDEIFLMDGEGSFYRAQVTLASSKHCSYQVLERMAPPKDWRGRIHLAVAPTKMMERMEWMAEKATEIGFDQLSLLCCKFSERKVVNVQRLDKIIISAVKQSRKPYKPVLSPLVPFDQFVSTPREGLKFIAHCYDEIPRQDLFSTLQAQTGDMECTILVGPEGDFSIDEVHLAMSHGYVPVSLGNFRLRTETAGLMAVAMAQLVLRR